MQSPLSRYAMLIRRWLWLLVLGVVICGGLTYGVSKLLPPVYRASAILLVNIGTSTSPNDNFTGSQLAAPTYAQMLTSPQVLRPVLAHHPGLTLKQLSDMVAAKPQPNTSLIELDVDNTDPNFAAQLANEISQSFVSYAAAMHLSGTIQILPAEKPTDPIRPKPLSYTGIGALVGLGLAIALIIIFEWIDDRLARPEEVQELLGMEIFAILPRLSRHQRIMGAGETPAMAEACRILCANLNAAQAAQPFKLVMVTSALADEGKSTVAVNLASFLAATGKRVLLVDADLYHSAIHQHFQLDNHQGLSNAFLEISAQLKVGWDGQATDIPTLRVLTAGVSSSNSAELLQSELATQLFDYFRKAPFDYVIFDTSPLLLVADTQILASHVQAAILVVDVSKTPRRVLLQAKRVLNKTRLVLQGVVINKSPWPEYSDIREYLGNIPRPKTSISIAEIPNTPPVDDSIDHDTTVITPQKHKASGKK